MKSLVDRFSIGRLTAWLADAVGWSPVGKVLELHGAEGPYADLFNGTIGTVLSLEDGVVVLQPYGSCPAVKAGIPRLRLTPRHGGWTPHSLMLSSIAVVVEAPSSDGRVGPVTIAIARIVRPAGPG